MTNYTPKANAAQTGIGLLIIAALTCLLYVPFLENALVFDDHNFFTSLIIYDYAISPLSLTPRNFPYFTLGFSEVLWKSIPVHRSISLLLHLINAFLIYRLTKRWLIEIGKQAPQPANTAALFASIFFAIHPVAVYGAGYLAQRTILFATLFSLLALWFYWRGLIRNSFADTVTAALCYALAIFSKEHAIMLPAAALLLTGLSPLEWAQKKAKAITFAALCIPTAVYIVLWIKGVIGTPYEPDSANFATAIPVENSHAMQWALSVVTQTGLFFKYVLCWLWPDVRNMSADIRIDFTSTWSAAWIATKLTAFAMYGLIGVTLLRRKGMCSLFGWGMLYVLLMFSTELVSVRFQEPFVLYRSYLWALGIVTLIACSATFLNRSKYWVQFGIGILLATGLLALSQNRLTSLASDAALWADSAEKLESSKLPGAERIFYNRGVQELNTNQPEAGLADMKQVILLRPDIFQGYLGQAKAYQHLGKHELALSNYATALDITTRQGNTAMMGSIEYDRSLSLTVLHRKDEAHAALVRAASYGHSVAKILLDQRSADTTAHSN